MSKRLEIGSTCKNGHLVTEENHFVQMRKGVESIGCKKCKRERNRAYQQKSEAYKAKRKEYDAKRRRDWKAINAKRVDTNRVAANEAKLEVEVKQGAGNYNSLNYLKLNKRGRDASTPLETAMDAGTRAKCFGMEELWIDYDHQNPDHDESDRSTWPSKQLAEAMCHGCPLLRECGRFATATKPRMGVWAGQVWFEGKIVREEEEEA